MSSMACPRSTTSFLPVYLIFIRSWNVIKATCGPVIHRVVSMKFLDPRTSENEMNSFFAAVNDDINSAFDELAD